MALLTRSEIGQMWHKPKLAVKGALHSFFHGLRNLFVHRLDILWGGSGSSIQLQPHGRTSLTRSRFLSQVLDYGTFGLWAGLLAGGRIVLPSGSLTVSLLPPQLLTFG